jgi:antitoxin YefM
MGVGGDVWGIHLDMPTLDIIMSNMTAISYTAARENLASTMDRVCADHAPVIITRNRDQSVVMLSLADYEALEETAYLTRNPVNAKRLLDAMEQLESGRGVKRDIDLDS